MSDMRDEDLRRLFEELPRHQASEAFTQRVLEGVEREPAAARAWRRVVWLPAVAALAGAVWISSAVSKRREERRIAAERVEKMRREYRDLQRELDRLRSLTSDVEPIIELGGTEDVDFVFDARRFRAPSRGRAEPVSHSTR